MTKIRTTILIDDADDLTVFQQLAAELGLMATGGPTTGREGAAGRLVSMIAAACRVDRFAVREFMREMQEIARRIE